MKNMRCKFLSFLLACAMVLGMMPATAYATGITNSDLGGGVSVTGPDERVLVLNEEQEFELQDEEHQITYTYTAEEAGTYVFYFKDLTTDGISFVYNKRHDSYFHDGEDGKFEGHVFALEAEECFAATFGVAEGGETYSATVGIATLPEEFTGFYAKGGVLEEAWDFEGYIEDGFLSLSFCAENPLCYGVEWSASSSDTEVLVLNEERSSRDATSYAPEFELKNLGEAVVTITATYNEITLTREYVVQVREGSGEGGSDEETTDTFTTLEELKGLMGAGEELDVEYVGEEPLVMDEDLMFPDGSRIRADGKTVVIEENANVTVYFLDCEDLEVKGTLLANEHVSVNNELEVSGRLISRLGLNINKKATVSGELIVSEHFLDMEYPAVIEGLDNIKFAEEYQKIVMNVRYDGFAKLKDLSEHVAENGYEDPKVQHIYRFEKEDTAPRTVDLVIDEDLTISKNTRLELHDLKSVTIASGTTLTVDGEMNLCSPATVNGFLVNNGLVDMDYNENGKLVWTEEEAYTGSGEIQVYCFGPADFENCFVPASKDDFEVTYDIDEDNGYYYYHVKWVKGLIKLGTPYDLTWGICWEEDLEFNEEDGTITVTGYRSSVKPGFLSWKTKRPDQAQAEVKIYRKGETEPCHSAHYGFGEDYQPEIRCVDLFAESDLGSGTYYFTVQSMADYETYRNSDVAVSGYYTYVQPSEQLSACSNLQWLDKNDIFTSWTTWGGATPSAYVDGYQIMFYFCETENGFYEEYGGIGGRGGNPNFLEEPMHDDFIQERGVGYYKFAVRPLSSDITKYRNGEWSELSPALNVKKISDDMTDSLDQVLNANLPAQDIVDTVQSMDTTDLKTTLLADQDKSGATEILKQLENQVGGQANVVVTRDASAFNVNDVEIVGANLNNKVAGAETITLKVDKPEKQHVIPELYKSSVAVQFSMNLENVEDPENLDVPVKITLPVPTSINPEFLVILHYHQDGTHEIIEPYLYEKDGKIYADFVLTSFSDFVFTERIPNRGDDGNTGNDGGSNGGNQSSDQNSGGQVQTTVTAPNTADHTSGLLYALLVAVCGFVAILGFKKVRY